MIGYSLAIILSMNFLLANGAMDENSVVSTLKQIESVAFAIRDELENAYSARCDAETLAGCDGQNFNSCSSKFPSPYCANPSDHGFSSTECSCGCKFT